MVAVWSLPSVAKPPENAIRLRVGRIAEATVRAGDSVVVKIPISVARGFHVNANPAASDDYIPLEVKLDSTSGVRAGAPIYPKGKMWRLAGTTENLLVYGGDFDVRIPLVVDRDVKPGELVIRGTVEFQACDNQVCFIPESLPIAVPVDVVNQK